jgi:hypothetical protein
MKGQSMTNALDYTIARFKGKPKPHARALRIRCVGDLASAGWFFIITNTDGQPVARNLGALPAYYAGLRWSPATATLYALAMAARWVARFEPQSRVVMICAEPRASVSANSAKVRRAA